MRYYQKYLAIFLLLAFAWVLLPPATMHELFADHHDTVCDLKHYHDVVTVETQHVHCPIFVTNTPLYDAPSIAVFPPPARLLIAELVQQFTSDLHLFNTITLPARAPPLS